MAMHMVGFRSWLDAVDLSLVTLSPSCHAAMALPAIIHDTDHSIELPSRRMHGLLRII
jgi:hypothetical protein